LPSRFEATADVAILGAGPAGAAVALMLAPFHATLLIDKADLDGEPRQAQRIGESLPGAARRLLLDLGLWEDFTRQGHRPCHGSQSLWGGDAPSWSDTVRDPDGHGWSLDRNRFDDWLRRRANDRGAPVIAPAKLVGVIRDAHDWLLTLTRRDRRFTVRARFVVDAGGRAAPLARALGHRRHRADRLICRWAHGVGGARLGLRSTAAEAEGWWYAADLPDGRSVLAFHTDADLPAAKATELTADLVTRALARRDIADLLGVCEFEPTGKAGYCAAHSSWIAFGGPGWLSVGDAALACDPLSSQGLLNALYSGLIAAVAIRRMLAGDSDAQHSYWRTMKRVAEAYWTHRAAWYGTETRWSDSAFWARRQTSPERTITEETPT